MIGEMRKDLNLNQSHGRRHRIKAISSEKLPPLLSTKNIMNEFGSGSRKRIDQLHHSEKGNNNRQKIYTQEPINDAQAIFLKQALGKDLVPINFEMKAWQVGEKARLNTNLATIAGNNTSNPHHVQDNNKLKSSSNPRLL